MHDTSTAVPLVNRVLTLSETAAVLRISRGSAYEAARRGEIPTIQIGRRLLVPLEALEKMLSGSQEGERAQPADRRGAHGATFSRRVSSPAAGRRKARARQLPPSIST
jgi:excisionase family DNA binding protein